MFNKYYVIQRLDDGRYLKGMSHDTWVDIKNAGTWPDEESATIWLDKGVTEPGRYAIVAIWSKRSL